MNVKIKGRAHRSYRPTPKQLNDHVVQEAAIKWRDVGIQLFHDSANSILNIIEANNHNVSNFMGIYGMYLFADRAVLKNAVK